MLAIKLKQGISKSGYKETKKEKKTKTKTKTMKMKMKSKASSAEAAAAAETEPLLSTSTVMVKDTSAGGRPTRDPGLEAHPLPYLAHATDNLYAVLDCDEGARCVYCMGSPKITKHTQTCGVSTIMCPDCGIDAVVPASVVTSETQLETWHASGFGYDLEPEPGAQCSNDAYIFNGSKVKLVITCNKTRGKGNRKGKGKGGGKGKGKPKSAVAAKVAGTASPQPGTASPQPHLRSPSPRRLPRQVSLKPKKSDAAAEWLPPATNKRQGRDQLAKTVAHEERAAAMRLKVANAMKWRPKAKADKCCGRRNARLVKVSNWKVKVQKGTTKQKKQKAKVIREKKAKVVDTPSRHPRRTSSKHHRPGTVAKHMMEICAFLHAKHAAAVRRLAALSRGRPKKAENPAAGKAEKITATATSNAAKAATAKTAKGKQRGKQKGKGKRKRKRKANSARKAEVLSKEAAKVVAKAKVEAKAKKKAKARLSEIKIATKHVDFSLIGCDFSISG